MAPFPGGMSNLAGSKKRGSISDALRCANGFSESSQRSFAEDEGLGIQAVTETGRRRAIGKDVSQMSVTAATTNFRADHSMTSILDLEDIFPREGLEKTGPPRPGLKLCLGAKQRQIAARTEVDARLLIVQERPAERPLGPLGAENLKPFRPKMIELKNTEKRQIAVATFMRKGA